MALAARGSRQLGDTEEQIEDAAAIAQVHIESHREAYVATGRMPSGTIEAWSEAARAEYWSQFAERQARDERILVIAEIDA